VHLDTLCHTVSNFELIVYTNAKIEKKSSNHAVMHCFVYSDAVIGLCAY